MPYTDQSLPHAGSAEVLFSGMFDEPAGTIARTMPRATGGVANLAGGATGTVQARLIVLPAGMVVSNIALLSGNTAEVGGSHFWSGLTDLASNVLAVTADQTGATVVAANTFLKTALLNQLVIPQTGLYYVVFSVSAATTMPTWAGNSLVTGLGSQPPLLSGSMGTQAAPPAVGAQLGAVVVTSQINYFAWLS